jgi:dolichyl-phosphate beta-glucosyltransferase
MATTTIVVPCFNEAHRLPVDDFCRFANQWLDGSFLFVDDGSTDDTAAILTALTDSAPNHFQVLRLARNSGKGEAVRRGILLAFQANPEYLGFWDADLATPLEVIPLFLQTLRERPTTEIVLGARVKLLGRDIQRRALRHLLGRVFASAVATVLGLEVYDSQCGAKLFRRTQTLRAVFEAPFVSRWIFDVEILARFMALKQLRFPAVAHSLLYELPLPIWHDVAGSKLHATDFIRAGYDLARIRQSIRSGHGLSPLA